MFRAGRRYDVLVDEKLKLDGEVEAVQPQAVAQSTNQSTPYSVLSAVFRSALSKLVSLSKTINSSI